MCNEVPKFSMTEEICSVMIVIFIILWISIDHSILSGWRNQVVSYMTNICRIWKSTDDDMAVIDISQMHSNAWGSNKDLQRFQVVYLLKWERKMDEIVYYLDKELKEERKMGIGLNMNMHWSVEWCNTEMNSEAVIGFKLLMPQGLEGKFWGESNDEKRNKKTNKHKTDTKMKQIVSKESVSGSGEQSDRPVGVMKNRHGTVRNIKYGDNTWFYNRRIERRIKGERKKRNEQRLNEMVERWKNGSNIELDVEKILVDMMEVNYSWVAIHCTPMYCSPRRVEKKVRKNVQVVNWRRR